MSALASPAPSPEWQLVVEDEDVATVCPGDSFDLFDGTESVFGRTHLTVDEVVGFVLRGLAPAEVAMLRRRLVEAKRCAAEMLEGEKPNYPGACGALGGTVDGILAYLDVKGAAS